MRGWTLTRESSGVNGQRENSNRHSLTLLHQIPPRNLFIFAAVTGVLGLVLAPQLLVLHLSPRDQEVRAPKLLSQGAALAAGMWIVLVTLTLVGQIIASKP